MLSYTAPYDVVPQIHDEIFVAQELGYFAEQGLKVELVEFQNSADGLAAVRAGKLDFGAFGAT